MLIIIQTVKIPMTSTHSEKTEWKSSKNYRKRALKALCSWTWLNPHPCYLEIQAPLTYQINIFRSIGGNLNKFLNGWCKSKREERNDSIQCVWEISYPCTIICIEKVDLYFVVSFIPNTDLPNFCNNMSEPYNMHLRTRTRMSLSEHNHLEFWPFRSGSR